MLPGMKGMTQEPGSCRDCGKDLPTPRRSNKKRCDDCSHERDRKRTADWYAAHAQASAKIHCEFRGGADLPEKYLRYRPAAPCLGEFERANPREVYCDNCKPVARKWQQLRAQTARYEANPKKYRRRARVYRGNRAKSAGRKLRRVGRTYKCEYRDKRGKRGKGCLGTYKLRSSAQRYCDPCQLRADSDRAQKYRDDHHEELLPVYREKGKTLRRLAKKGKRVEAGEFVPAPPIEPIVKARITMAASLQIEERKPYAMKDRLYPIRPHGEDLAASAKERDRQFDSTKKFLKKHSPRIALEKLRLTGLSEQERDATAAEAAQFIHSFHSLP